jgi:PleD family two-component response regulator
MQSSAALIKELWERELLMSKSVIAVVDDMFFASKIRAVAEHLGLNVRFARSVDEALEAARTEAPSLIIADLHAQKCDPFNLAEQLKMDETLRAVPLLGFFSHVQTELQQRAQQAGYDRIMPRSAFSKNLPEILGEAGSESG